MLGANGGLLVDACPGMHKLNLCFLSATLLLAVQRSDWQPYTKGCPKYARETMAVIAHTGGCENATPKLSIIHQTLKSRHM